MLRSICLLPPLVLFGLFAPGPRATLAADTPFASAPGITVTATSLTPDGGQLRTYRSGNTESPWRNGLPVYRKDVFRVKVFLNAPGAHSPVLTFKLDNRARPSNLGDPFTWDIDTGQLGLGDHMVNVTLQIGGRSEGGPDVSASFLVSGSPALSSPPSPDAEPEPIPPPSFVDEGRPPTNWRGGVGATDAQVVLRVADTEGVYNPKAGLPNPLIISISPTYIEVLPAKGIKGVTEFVFRIFRLGKPAYESLTESHYRCGPVNLTTETTLIDLYRSQDQKEPFGPLHPVLGLMDGDLKLYVWGIKDGRLGSPAIANLHVQAARAR